MANKYNGKTALITGATSGLGEAAAISLAKKGFARIIVTGRSGDKAAAAAKLIGKKARHKNVTPLALDLNNADDVNRAVSALEANGGAIDFLLLNAGLVPGGKLVRTPSGDEITMAASVIGHHQFTLGLLSKNLVAQDARIVIAGSEAARGDVPGMKLVDVPEFAKAHFGGDLERAIETIAQAHPPYEYKAFPHYGMVKLFVAYWAAALSRRVSSNISVYAISPGSAPLSGAMRNQPVPVQIIVGGLLGTVGKLAGLGASVPKAANRYLEGLTLAATDSGKFYASKPGKMTGDLYEQTQAHVLDKDAQEAAWAAISKISGGATL